MVLGDGEVEMAVSERLRLSVIFQLKMADA